MDKTLNLISRLRKLVTSNFVYKSLFRNRYLRTKMLSFIYQQDFAGLRHWQETELAKITEAPLFEFIDNAKNLKKIHRNEVQILQLYLQLFSSFGLQLRFRRQIRAAVLNRTWLMSRDEVGFEFEEGNFDFFLKGLNIARTTPSSLPVFLEFRRFVSKFWDRGVIAKPRVNWIRRLNYLDGPESFQNKPRTLIRILGPVSPERNADQTGEIDCEIAVTGFWNSNAPTVKHPVTCYLNDETLLKLGPRLFEVADFSKNVIVKGLRSFFYSWKILGPRRVFAKVRCLRSADRLLPMNIYGPTALQSLIYDLRYRFQGTLHACGFTFWAEAKADYLPGYSDFPEKLGLNVRVHEPISNFLFVKQLVRAGVLDVCGQMNTILTSSPESYCEKLDHRFPPLG